MKLLSPQIYLFGLTAMFLQTTITSCQRAATYESQLEHFDKIPSTSRIVKSAKYISPKDALSEKSRRPRRKSPAQKSTHDSDAFAYIDRYHEFLDKNFNDRLERLEAQKAEKRPSVESSFESSSDDDDNAYNYKSDYFPSNEYAKIKAESDAQAAEIRKDPKHCKQVTKGDMTCFTCSNPETGAQSQSCSFSSEPVSKKYAYQKEKKYDSKDQDPEEEDDNQNSEEDGEEVEVVDKRHHKTGTEKRSESIKVAPRSERIASQGYKKAPIRTVKKSNYETTEKRPQRDVIGLASSFFANFDSTEDDITNPSGSEKLRSYDDYYRHVFPAKNKEKLQQAPVTKTIDADFEYVDDDFAAKKDVEKALAEFKIKDWSNCDEMVRGDMTCYACQDKGGVKHEECVYVSETRPGITVVAASSEEKIKADQSNAETTTEKVRKRPLKKATANKKSVKSLKATKKPKAVAEQEKRTIKRKLTIKVDDEMEPLKSRSMHYEHHVSHVE